MCAGMVVEQEGAVAEVMPVGETRETFGSRSAQPVNGRTRFALIVRDVVTLATNDASAL